MTTTLADPPPRAASDRGPDRSTAESPAAGALGFPAACRAAAALAQREVVRFLRQRSRVIGALGQPVLFWLLFGLGLRESFALSPAGAEGTSFLAYYFPGTLVLIVLFTAIFATISIIEDRREGFLQGVLVAPIPRWAIVAGKVGGATLLAVGQGLPFLACGLFLEVAWEPLRLVALVGLLSVASVALTSLGFVLAWRLDSTQGFHAVMNLLLLPMWLLSGAFFPIPAADAAGAQAVLHWTMRLNPVTYVVAAARELLFAAGPPADRFWSPSLAVCWIVVGAFAVAMLLAARRAASTPRLG